MIKKKSSNNSNIRRKDNTIKAKDYSILDNNLQNKKVMNDNNGKENYKNKIYKKNNEKSSIFFKKQKLSNKNVKVNVSPIKKSHKKYNVINYTDINTHDGRSTPFPENRVKKINNYSSKNFSHIIEYAKDLPFDTSNQRKKIKRVVTQKKLLVNDNVYYKRNIQNEPKIEKYYTEYTFDNLKYICNNFNSSDNIIEIEENQEYCDYEKLQSKIGKNMMNKSFNRLIKICYSFVKNDFLIFLNKLKAISSQKIIRPKTYKKKSVINRNLASSQNFSSQYSTKNAKNDFSPFNGFKSIKTAKLKFEEENNFINSSTKKNDTYSSYYNINCEEGKESNSNTIKSYKTYSRINNSNKDKIKFINEFKSDIYIKKNNIKSKKLNNNEYSAKKEKTKTIFTKKISTEYNTLTDKKEKNFNINNNDNNIKTLRQNQSIVLNRNNLIMDDDIKTLRQNQSIVFNKKYLIIENKNSFNYLNKSSQKSKSNKKTKKSFDIKKGILDKIKVNIIKNKDEMKMKRKKTYFKLFINKLRNFAFCVHMQNLLLNKNNENKINISSSQNKEILKNEETIKISNIISEDENTSKRINNNNENEIKSNNNIGNNLNDNIIKEESNNDGDLNSNLVKEENNNIDDLNVNTIKEENDDNENENEIDILKKNINKEENNYNDTDNNIYKNLTKEKNENENNNINGITTNEENIKKENIIEKRNNENHNENFDEEKNNEIKNEKINEENNNGNKIEKINEEKNKEKINKEKDNENNKEKINEEKDNENNKEKINEESDNENNKDKINEEKDNENNK